MVDESDGIEEALEGTMRLAAMAGARLGSEIARAREERLRQQQHRSDLDARQLAARFEAEKRVAVSELSRVHRPDWWKRADAERIGQTYATARAWAPEAEEADRAERRMRDELQARYGVDLDRSDPRAGGSEVEAWRGRLEQQRRDQAERQRTTARVERAEAAALLGQAAREERRVGDARRSAQRDGMPPVVSSEEDTAAQARRNMEYLQSTAAEWNAAKKQRDAEAAKQYDSADRREAAAAALEQDGVDPEVATIRMQADTGAAKPATLATAGAGRRSKAPKARKSTSRGVDRARPGLER